MPDQNAPILKNDRTAEVLLVEDDTVLRGIIGKLLTQRGVNVREAPNGLVAKTIFEMDPLKFDLIISDIRMPELDGVALLKLVRAAGKVPFIVMTGFSEVIEAKNAFELGANEFLPKPVKTLALLEAIARCFNPVEKTAKTAESEKSKDEDFCHIHVDEFVSTSHLRSDIYLKLGAKYIKVALKGDVVPVDRLRKYQASSVDYLHVKVEDFRTYVNLNIQISAILNNSNTVKTDAKLKILKHTAEVIVESCFREGFDKPLFDSAARIVNDTVNLVTQNDDILATLTQMQSGANRMYTHAVAVSVFSAMIAKSVGWTSLSTQSKVSLCGLFHDLGKKEIPAELFQKKRILLSVDEVQRIEAHVLRGRDLLIGMPSVPEDVAEVAYQHHENFNGTGYPQGLKGEHIHPLARVVRVADLFVSLMLPLEDDQRLEAPAALLKLERGHDGEYDPTYLRGLSKALGIPLQNPDKKRVG